MRISASYLSMSTFVGFASATQAISANGRCSSIELFFPEKFFSVTSTEASKKFGCHLTRIGISASYLIISVVCRFYFSRSKGKAFLFELFFYKMTFLGRVCMSSSRGYCCFSVRLQAQSKVSSFFPVANNNLRYNLGLP